MTLQQAIEEVKRSHKECGEFEDEEIFEGIDGGPYATAIATILNAVVKGELRPPEMMMGERQKIGHALRRPSPIPEIRDHEDREAYNLRVYGLREEDME